MRKDGIPYVPNPPMHMYPSKDLEEMTLEEIVKKYLRTCGKSNGNVAVCSQCKSPCKEGKRAIQLLANKVYNDPPIPLYGGKTLIERAREENMKRREKMGETNMSALAKALEDAKKEALEKDGIKTEKKKRGHIVWDNWWEISLESGDQVKWIMDNMKLSKTQAKKKIYQYKWYHGMTGSANAEKVEAKKEVQKEVQTQRNDVFDASIESKLEALMKQQEECKKEVEKYQHLADEARQKYEAIKKKTDVLCSAMDIINE